jgi:hypothetical protein
VGKKYRRNGAFSYAFSHPTPGRVNFVRLPRITSTTPKSRASADVPDVGSISGEVGVEVPELAFQLKVSVAPELVNVATQVPNDASAGLPSLMTPEPVRTRKLAEQLAPSSSRE